MTNRVRSCQPGWSFEDRAMRSFAWRRVVGWKLSPIVLSLVLAAGWLPPALGQDATGEEKALREELEKARREIERLREENARLKGGQTSVPATSPAPAAPGVGAIPVSSPVAVPAAVSGGTVVLPAPAAEGSLVSLEQLLAEYQTSALAGDARYKGRRFRIEGKVHDFKKAFVGLGWTVHLKAGDRLGLARCQVSFPGISDFKPSTNNAILEGRRPFQEWNVLLQRGQPVVFEGVCEGIDDAVVSFRNCRPAGPS